MNIKRVLDLYEVIKNELPSTYPRPKLAFFEDEETMLKNNKMRIRKDENVYAVVSPETLTISFPLNMTFEYTNSKGEDYNKTIPINKFSDEEIAHTIFHEIAHLYFGEKYGYGSKQYSDEKGCDRFADRWVKKFKTRRLI